MVETALHVPLDGALCRYPFDEDDARPTLGRVQNSSKKAEAHEPIKSARFQLLTFNF